MGKRPKLRPDPDPSFAEAFRSEFPPFTATSVAVSAAMQPTTSPPPPNETDAATYEQIESSNVHHEGIRVTSRFRTYEVLPATEATLALLSLTAQHPGATIEPSLEIEGVAPAPGK